LQTNFYGDHNLGLFGKSSDRFCLVGNFVQEKTKQKIEEVLKVKVIRATVANTDLVGIFCCLNSNGILLPRILTRTEVENFKKLKKEFGVNLEVLKSKFTALGNLVLCNDKGAVVSRLFSKTNKKRIEDCLGVEADYCSVAGMHTVGSTGVASNKGCVVHRDASEKEVKKIGEILKVQTDIGTANFGSPFVGSCAFGNSNGIVLGQSTTGPEITRFMEVLDLM
jgi:translation initiation factor 6